MTILSVYNNKKLLEAGLLASNPLVLKACELILIDNSGNQFKSFGEAIHSNLEKCADDEILIICHQDVIFYDVKSFSEITTYIGQIIREGQFLAGVTGRRRQPSFREGIGLNDIITGGRLLDYQPIKAPESVDVIDECVIITNKRTINGLSLFCDNNFDWHLYAADACLAVSQNGILPYVFPIRVNHLSRGNIDANYFRLAKKLLKKYQVPAIYTTCGILTKRIITLRQLKLYKSSIMENISTSIKNILKFL